ncbi:MAG TPA: SDR family NAD(P)-dependent oxidoreductase [Mycobacteriales bacterium]|nr:SDR family NAD(P)-dependent oxidoreductase [Mycobacteriales bacterium]
MALFDLTGRRALVTGASRGIGHAIAVALAAHGADVAVNSRSADNLARVSADVTAEGRRALAVPADVTDRDAARSMVEAALDGLGGLDVVVNNAGGTSFMVPFTQMRFSGWEKVMRLNVDSIVHVLQAAAPHLLERRSGSVINVSSVAGVGGTRMLAPYGASKSAVISLTRSLAMEWGHANVRVNALCPGWTATELNRNLWEDPDASKALTDQIPLGRWARAEEMVGAAVFLASDASSYLTGHALLVDGGLTAG